MFSIRSDGVLLLVSIATAMSSVAGFGLPLSIHQKVFALPVSQFKSALNVNKQVQALRASFSGQDEAKWMPPLKYMFASDPSPDAFVIPVFPHERLVFVPTTKPTIKTSELRYIQMFNDTLNSGSRRFAVCSMDSGAERLSEVASVLYLKELKEVSQKKNAKYVCGCEVIGRVKLTKILNPSAWIEQSTYLKAEAIELQDTSEGEAESKAAEEAFRGTYRELFNMLRKDPLQLLLFRKVVPQVELVAPQDLNLSPGQGLWSTVSLWNDMQILWVLECFERHEENRKAVEELLSKAAQDGSISTNPELRAFKAGYDEDIAPTLEEYVSGMVLVLQADTHSARLKQLGRLVASKTRQLAVKKMLSSLGD